MSSRLVNRITDTDIDTFERDGAVCLRQMFGQEWLDLLAQGVENAMSSSGRYTRQQSGDDDPGLYFSDYWASQRTPALREFVLNSPAAHITKDILRSSRINFFYDAVWVKEPGTQKRGAWHQDQPYYCVDGKQICIVWVPIDPVPKEVCLQLVRGSHRWGKSFAPIRFVDGGGYGRADHGYEPMPDIDNNLDQYEILSWELSPGDCIIFQGMLIHGSPSNITGGRRRAVSTTWLGDDTTYIERPGEMEPHPLEHNLKPGDSLDCDTFPRILPR